uniref:Uncharacterized protein n=1 Tax=Timema douglasi TaxID=61478 RepID=A0A7R8VP85_TIMDO|nr:unnamed protein product [Timema douglasi]
MGGLVLAAVNLPGVKMTRTIKRRCISIEIEYLEYIGDKRPACGSNQNLQVALTTRTVGTGVEEEVGRSPRKSHIELGVEPGTSLEKVSKLRSHSLPPDGSGSDLSPPRDLPRATAFLLTGLVQTSVTSSRARFQCLSKAATKAIQYPRIPFMFRIYT